MAILFIDGMDWGTAENVGPTIASTPLKWINYSSGGSVNVNAGRVPVTTPGGGNSVNIGNAGFRQATMTKRVGTQPTLVVGFWYRQSNAVMDDTVIVRFEAGAATLINAGGFDDGTNTSTVLWLRQRATGAIDVYAGDGSQCGTPTFPGTFLATLNTNITTRTWYNLEVIVKPGGWEVWVNDVLDTAQTVVLPFTPSAFSFQKQGFEAYQLDDLYCADERLGPCQVTAFPPIQQGGTQWTPASPPNLSQVSEFGNRGNGSIPTPDGDSTYVSTSSAGNQDFYSFTDPACYGLILALAVNIDARAQVSAPEVDAVYNNYGTMGLFGLAQPALGGTYAMYQAIRETSPADSSTWNDETISLLQFGYRLSGSGTARVSQIFLEKLVSLRSVPYDCAGGAFSFTQP